MVISSNHHYFEIKIISFCLFKSGQQIPMAMQSHAFESAAELHSSEIAVHQELNYRALKGY